jgi:hypothetical protein
MPSCAARLLVAPLVREPPPERSLVDVVDEGALPVDLHDGQPFAVAGLELGVAADVDLFEIERRVVAHTNEHVASPLAEVTASCVIERDARQGRTRNRTVARLGVASLGNVGQAARRSS